MLTQCLYLRIKLRFMRWRNCTAWKNLADVCFLHFISHSILRTAMMWNQGQWYVLFGQRTLARSIDRSREIGRGGILLSTDRKKFKSYEVLSPWIHKYIHIPYNRSSLMMLHCINIHNYEWHVTSIRILCISSSFKVISIIVFWPVTFKI